MSDYIKREDAIKAFDPKQRQDWYTPWIVETLKDLPSADVAPVRHGRWIITATDFTEYANCSLCYAQVYSEDAGRYCTNCGARMDKEDLDRWKDEQKAKGEY